LMCGGLDGKEGLLPWARRLAKALRRWPRHDLDSSKSRRRVKANVLLRQVIVVRCCPQRGQRNCLFRDAKVHSAFYPAPGCWAAGGRL